MGKWQVISRSGQSTLHFHQGFSDKKNYVFLSMPESPWVPRCSGLQSIFLFCLDLLFFFFFSFRDETGQGFKPCRVLMLQNPHIPTSSLSSALLYQFYCLLTDHMGNMLGKHASGFTSTINTFYDYSHYLQQQTRLVAHNYV